MKKPPHFPKLLLAAMVAAAVCASSVSAAQTITFDDLGTGGGTSTSGTFDSTSTFTLDVYLTFSGYTSPGLSYWLEVSSDLGAALSITSITYSTFTDANSTVSDPESFSASVGSSSGFLSNTHDLGATTSDASLVAAGTYAIAQITFALTNAAAGTYTLETTSVLPKLSIVTDSSFGDNSIPIATYNLTVVPEPSTGFLGAAGLVFCAVCARCRGLRKSGSGPKQPFPETHG